MTRAGPLGQESTLKVGVDQSLLHHRADGGVQQVDKRELAAESVPKAGTRIHLARQHLAVERAVVDGVAAGIDLIEGMREEHRAVQAGVEGAQVVDVVILDHHAAQSIVPALAAFCLDGFQVVAAHLA